MINNTILANPGDTHMKKLLITLTNKLHEDLKAEKRRTGASMAEIIRRAIVKYFKHQNTM